MPNSVSQLYDDLVARHGGAEMLGIVGTALARSVATLLAADVDPQSARAALDMLAMLPKPPPAPLTGEADPRIAERLNDREVEAFVYLCELLYGERERYSAEARATPWDVADALLHERGLQDALISRMARDNEHLVTERDKLREKLTAVEAAVAARPPSLSIPNVTPLRSAGLDP
jgi:hypothetical protein